jgi:N-acyl-L-homoserine lactone synthetase
MITFTKATDEALMTELERLRYQVYCLETHMLDERSCPDHRERDAYDRHSMHFAARHHGAVVGTLRLVFDSSLGFPLDRFQDALWPETLRLPRSRSAEGLFREMYRASREAGICYWLAAMEPSLQRLLGRFGFEFSQAGDPIEYYGRVIPYVAEIETLEQRVADRRPGVFTYFEDRPIVFS